MIRLYIVKTAKPYNPRETYRPYDEESKVFHNIKTAKEWLREQYGQCRKYKQYTDTKDGNYFHSGWIYGFKNRCERCYEQHWVSFYEMKPMQLSKEA